MTKKNTNIPDALAMDITLTKGPPSATVDSIGDPAAGGEVLFLGRTRDEAHPEYGPLRALHYTAYETMAIEQLKELAAQSKQKYGVSAVRIHHALGAVEPGQISVLIQVRSGHRAEAFEACRWLIDELKKSVPIWKQEIWQSSQTWSVSTADQASEATHP